MNVNLVDLGAVAILLTPLLVLLAILFADPIDLEIHAPPRVLDWPLGVQEEEPIRWRVDALSSRRRREAIAASAPDGKQDGIDRVPARLGSKPVA
jgi:hypothetical protein